ncbi:MAG: protein of unknown function DUF1003 [uncultured Sphingomonas sp.]|uniref:DUF1003 domain-containing protein n=1 Tax=uncultured Sphingomonas sp. TaxID=158754 RepID=A0A6J4SQQ3_9SPHN|nr:DUF1003 domain-containing protein [uncultured Sphingomonas sp.]CAA9502400.1 MAG: protein of unknown function DUF1003 [uncultured Sphingomonas sp.]
MAPSSGLATALERNIEALAERRRQEAADASLQDRLADAISQFAGSITFVGIHAVLVIAWVLVNVRLTPFEPFDPTFVILATVASVEAIFLSTFILISQNRAAAAADRRADLDLQISLLSEHEVTRLIELVARIADKLGIEEARNPELEELKRNVAPEAVLERIEESEGGK